MNKKVVIVLGMHRSGTSAVAAGLEAIGVSLGHDLFEGASDNPKGYYEDSEIVFFNDKLLSILNASWDSLAYGEPVDFGDKKFEKLIDEALSILKKKFLNDFVWGVKDPRMCLLLPFWQKVIHKMGKYDISYVHVLRSPLEVSRSQKARNIDDPRRHVFGGEDIENMMLWYSYHYQALRSVDNDRNFMIEYDVLIERPQELLEKLSSFIGIESDVNKVKEFADAFIDKKLRHHEPANNESDEIRRLGGDEILRLYSAMSGLASKEVFDKAEIVKLISTLPDMSFVYKYAGAYKGYISRLQKDLSLVYGKLDAILGLTGENLYIRSRSYDSEVALASVRRQYHELEAAYINMKHVTDLLQTYYNDPLIISKYIKRLPGMSFVTRVLRYIVRKSKFNEEYDLIQQSGLFDEDYYVSVNPDVDFSKDDPLTHYIRHGAVRGLDPSADFSSIKYYQENPEIRLNLDNPLFHYIKKPVFVDDADERKVVILDYAIPEYDRHAGARHIYMCARTFMHMGYKVVFISQSPVSDERYVNDLQSIGIEVLAPVSHGDNEQIFSWMWERNDSIDFIYMHRPQVAIDFIDFCKYMLGKYVLFDIADMESLRLRRQAQNEKNAAILARAEEAEKVEQYLFETFDYSFTPSGYELNIIRERYGVDSVGILPVYIYEEDEVISREPSAEKQVLFVGSFGHMPNLDAIQWFVSEIWPAVMQEHPDAIFNIVGANPPDNIRNLESGSIRIHGGVSDDELDNFYANAKVVVVPLRYGAGVKGKVIETIKNGIPLVSTSIGLEGIESIDDLIGSSDTSDEFASSVVEILYSDHHEVAKIASSYQNYIRSNYTEAAVIDMFSKVLNELGIRKLSLTTDQLSE